MTTITPDINEQPITLRLARDEDAERIERLAVLDSAVPPAEPVLLAEVDGDLLAAVSLSDQTLVADPFRPTAELVALLRARAEQLHPTQLGVRVGRRFLLRDVPAHRRGATLAMA
jgi:hypothetical protein